MVANRCIVRATTPVQPLLMARVAQSVNWFMGAMQAQGLLNNVLLYVPFGFCAALLFEWALRLLGRRLTLVLTRRFVSAGAINFAISFR